MAETYNVYFGPTGDLAVISAGQAGLSIVVPSILEYNTEYSWRVDAINVYGTTTGDTWSFTTLIFAPPLPTGMNSMITLKRIVAAANDKVFYET